MTPRPWVKSARLTTPFAEPKIEAVKKETRPYRLTLEKRPTYLHATVTGIHNAENALRFLTEAFDACARMEQSALLLEFNLAGPSLPSSAIFDVVSKRTKVAAKLRKIAYVDNSERDPEKVKFAETVARNRGVNVRLFREFEAAQSWLEAK